MYSLVVLTHVLCKEGYVYICEYVKRYCLCVYVCVYVSIYEIYAICVCI